MAENKSDYVDMQIDEQVKKIQSIPKAEETMKMLPPAPGKISIEVLIRKIVEKYGDKEVDGYLDSLDYLADAEIVTISESNESGYSVCLTSKGALFASKME